MSRETRAAIRNYLGLRLRAKTGIADFGDSDSLFISGWLDSLDATATIVFLEDAYNLNFSKIGFDLALIDSVDAVNSLVEKHNNRHAA